MFRALRNISLKFADIEVRSIRVSDAQNMRSILLNDREWLEPWEASFPGYKSTVPTVGQLKSSIRSLLKDAKRGLGSPFVMLHKGVLVGQLSVSDISWGAIQSGQIGYWIAQSSAGKNITPVCVALVSDYMLSSAGLHRIEICLRPENHASRRVVEKLGFRHEGLRKKYIFIDGAWRDHDCFAVTAEEIGAGILERLKKEILN